ncbi:MAG: metallophosphoesterase [Nakamurella sp.]
MRIVHISDTHLFGDDTLHYGVVDTTGALERVLQRAEAVADVDAVVLSGDISDDGSQASYQRAKDMAEPWATRHGAQPIFVMGNHDVRAGFEAVLGERIGVSTAAGLKIIRLDSSVPLAGYGDISADQLAWLQRELATGEDCVIVLHHPPTKAYSPLLQALQLQNPQRLLDVCQAGNVRAILAGHYHHPMVTMERGIPVVVAPGVANTTDVCAHVGHERATVGAGFAVIDIAARGTHAGDVRVTFLTAPSLEDGTEIFDLDAAKVAGIAASAGPKTS